MIKEGDLESRFRDKLLILFGFVRAQLHLRLGIVTMSRYDAAGAGLRDVSYAFVIPRVSYTLVIPAGIRVRRDEIGVRARHLSHNDRACAVQRFHHWNEMLRRRRVRFVADRPHRDRRMVVVLLHHFRRNLISCWGNLVFVGVPILGPAENPELVAEIVFQLCVRIMRQTKEVDPQILQEREVRQEVLVGQRRRLGFGLLVKAYSHQANLLAVQGHRPFLENQRTEARWLPNRIHGLPAPLDFRQHPIQIRRAGRP